MAKKQNLETALSAILTDQPIAYHPILASISGGVQAGVFLSQLLYWTPRGKDPDGWIWKSKPDWQEETGMTATEVDHARKDLKERGIIEERLAGVPATIHYRANITRIADLLTNGYSSDIELPERDERGRFLSDDGNPGNCPSSRETRQLDSGNPGSKPTGIPAASDPENGSLSIDYQRLSESTSENTDGANAPHTPNFLALSLAYGESDADCDEQDAVDKRAHFMALAEVCSIMVDLASVNQKRQLGQSAKLLREKVGAQPEDIMRFRAWWDENDWRGKKGQAPTPSQVREEWGKFAKAFGDGGQEIVRVNR